MMKISLIFLCLSIVQSSTALARCYELVVDKIFDGKEFSPQSSLYIEDDLIITKQQFETLAGCQVLKRSGYTALPGFIDVHTHLFLDDSTFATDFASGVVMSALRSDQERLKMAKSRVDAYKKAGFIILRNLGNSGRELDQILIKSLSADDPIVLSSGPGISALGGQFKLGTSQKIVQKEYDQIVHRDEICPIVKRRKEDGHSSIKVYADNEPNPNYQSKSILRKIARCAKKHQLDIVVHAVDKRSVENALLMEPTAIVHAYEVGPQLLTKMKEHSTYLIPTDFGEHIVNLLQSKLTAPLKDKFISIMAKYRDLSLARCQMLKGSNVKVAFGSDYYFSTEELGVPFIEGVKSSYYSLTECGLTLSESIAAMTSNAAKLLRLSEYGYLTPGHKATIVLVKGDVGKIQDLASIAEVIREGKTENNL